MYYTTKSLPIIDIFNDYVYLNVSIKTYLNGTLIDFKNEREIISSGGASIGAYPDNSDFGIAYANYVLYPYIGVRPCFML